MDVLLGIVAVFFLGWALAHAEIGLRKSLRDIDRVTKPRRPFDHEADNVWADLERHALIRWRPDR